MRSQDPLAIFHPENFWKTTFTDEENSVIESARDAIATAVRGSITPELYEKYKGYLSKFIDMSPNKVAAARHLLENISREEGLAGAYLTLQNGFTLFKKNGRGLKRSRQTMEE